MLCMKTHDYTYSEARLYSALHTYILNLKKSNVPGQKEQQAM